MNKNFFNIVLHNPEIPQNAGNIARMCVANDLKLHFIKPMGFEITDKHLKRAALDYWKFLDYEIYDSWEIFLQKNLLLPNKISAKKENLITNQNKEDIKNHEQNPKESNNKNTKTEIKNPQIWLLTTKSKKAYWDIKFNPGDYLIFGAETRGLPEEIRNAHSNQCITIPMSSTNSRSLNLASSVQTVYYEAFRQNN